MSLPILGMLDLGMQILKLLAVAGGATVGGLGSGLLLRLVVRLSVHRPVPRKILVPVRILGAIALGLAVGVWAFTSGGSGPGLGGLFGSGGSGGTTPAAKTESVSESQQKTDDGAKMKSLGPQSERSPGTDTMRIEILGGARVQEERFYLIEGENKPRRLAEVRKAIQARQEEKDTPPLKGIVIMIYGLSVARSHPAVRNLQKWAEEHRLDVTFPSTRGDVP